MKKTGKQTSMFDFFNRKKEQGERKETKPKSEEKEFSRPENHEKRNYRDNESKNKVHENRESTEIRINTVNRTSPRKRASDQEGHETVKKNKVENEHKGKYDDDESEKKLSDKTGQQLKHKKLKVINKFLQPEECDNEDKEIENSSVKTTSPSPNKSSKYSPGHSRGERMFLTPLATESRKKLIKQKFLVEMPEDFYSLFSLCEKLSKSDPLGAFSELGVYLVGPYDILAGRKLKCEDQSEYLRHWRFYFDPPEFQTVVSVDNKDQFHMGYYRDDPKEMPCFVASNCASKGCKLIPMTSNILAALHTYFTSLLKDDHHSTKKDVINRYLKAIEKWAQPNGYKLNTFIPGMNTRKRKIVAKTFHGAGIVVPVDKKMDLGYRPLIVSEEKLKRLFQNVSRSKTKEERDRHLSELQPVITAAMIAVDECDFGTALELGINMFCNGNEVFHPMILQSLTTAYSLLQRGEFAQIIEAHLQNRKRENPSSELLPKYASPSKSDRHNLSPKKYDMFVNTASTSKYENTEDKDRNNVSEKTDSSAKRRRDENDCGSNEENIDRSEENSSGKRHVSETSKDMEGDSETSVNTQDCNYDSDSNKKVEIVNRAHAMSESEDSEETE